VQLEVEDFADAKSAGLEGSAKIAQRISFQTIVCIAFRQKIHHALPLGSTKSSETVSIDVTPSGGNVEDAGEGLSRELVPETIVCTNNQDGFDACEKVASAVVRR